MAPGDLGDSDQDQRVRGDFGFDPADHPFAREIAVFDPHQPQHRDGQRRHRGQPEIACASPQSDRQQQPTDQSSDPGGGFQRNDGRQRAERPIERRVGFAGGREQVGRTIAGVPEIFGFDQIVGFVDRRRRIARIDETQRQQRKDFHDARLIESALRGFDSWVGRFGAQR